MENLIGILIILAIFLLVYLDRKNIKREGVVFIRRSERFIKEIENFAFKHLKLLNILAIVSFFSYFVLIILAYYFIFNFLIQKLSGVIKEEIGIKIILPEFPGAEKLPFVFPINPIYFLPIIFIVALSHEIMHALLALKNNVKIKSIGYAFFLIIPAFFVEPNEKKLKKLESKKKIEIYSAGSFGNVLLAIFVLALIFLISQIFNLIFEPYGIKYEVIPNTSAYYSNLSGIILYINDQRVKSVLELKNVLAKFKPNETIVIKTTEGDFRVTLGNESGRAFIGIKNVETYFVAKIKEFEIFKPAFYETLDFLSLLFLISIAIAIFNILPVKPLDGGYILEEILKIILKERYHFIFLTFQIFTIILLILIAIPIKPLISLFS